MSRRCTVYSQWFVAIAVLLLTPVLVLADPPKAGKQIRVKLSLEVTGTYQHTGPKEIPKGAMYLAIKESIDNSYTTEYVVAAETILTGARKTNPLDPASQQEMDEYNAKVAARNDRIYHSADHLRKPGMGGSARPGGMNPGMMDMGRMQEMQQKIMACGIDQACKQRVAMEMMSQRQAPQMPSGLNAQVQADIQTISNMCINEKGNKIGSKGYEQCMEAEGRKRSTVPASTADDEPEVPELPDRYFLYRNGVGNCQFKAHAKVNDSFTFGGIADGEGGGGYFESSGADKGESDADPNAFMPCSNGQAVFDPKTNLFWTSVSLLKVDAKAVRTGDVGYGGGVSLPREIDQWVASTLLGAPASGAKTEKFGYKTAKVSWSFVKE